ncbi:MAG: UDP-N-acetylmuramoyl-L-alanine--D-glutamate ligase [Holosporales bacterium]|nr:UDP-N-acetylmuramoyl-L-alanine--D-glutamate ligase [Holosporales bacterium]
MINEAFFASKKNILVIGYGTTGKSVYSFLRGNGHSVLVYDDFKGNVPGNLNLNRMPAVDLVIKSPSVPCMPHNIHPLIKKLCAAKIPVISAFDVFILHNPDAQIIGVTGTNGKSTTAALAHHIMKDNGTDVQLGGNIGIPYFDLPKAKLYIFEMSSYELASSRYLKFEIGCILNIEPDHLTFHGDFGNYVAAKHRLLENAKIKIISLEDSLTTERFGFKKEVIKVSTKNSPQADVCVFERAMIGHARAPILDLADVSALIGQHNYQNIEFAYSICRQCGVPDHLIVRSIRSFKPLPHRLNVVKKVGNVLFVNDSKATNPESAAKALATFVGFKIFWLVGGRSKNVNVMNSVGEYLTSVQKIYLFGESAEEFTQVFDEIKSTVNCKTMLSAIHLAYKDAMAEAGSVVILLSPMCSSFDQFNNFEHRGDEFVKAVEEISSIDSI